MDSDGHFTVHKSSKKGDRMFWNETYSPSVGLGQVTRAVPELLRKTFGRSIRIERRGGRSQPLFRWLVTNKRAVRAGACLLPTCRLRGHQARLLVDLSAYAGKDVRKAAYWYAQQHPTWANDRLLRTDEASALLGYESPARVYQAIHNGTLLAIPSRGQCAPAADPRGSCARDSRAANRSHDGHKPGPASAVATGARAHFFSACVKSTMWVLAEVVVQDHAAAVQCETRCVDTYHLSGDQLLNGLFGSTSPPSSIKLWARLFHAAAGALGPPLPVRH